MNNIKDLKFSHNWNNKLNATAFTTLRLHVPGRFFVGQKVRVTLKGQSRGIYSIKAIKRLTINKLNDYIAFIDTGYSLTECIKIIKTMYSKQNINWETQLLDFPLLVKETK